MRVPDQGAGGLPGRAGQERRVSGFQDPGWGTGGRSLPLQDIRTLRTPLGCCPKCPRTLGRMDI